MINQNLRSFAKTLRMTSGILFMVAGLAFGQAGNELKNYPKGFSNAALKNVRAEMQTKIDTSNVYYLHPLMTDAAIQTKLTQAASKTGSKVILSKGEYSTSSDFYMQGANTVSIEGNGATWDMNKKKITLTSNADYTDPEDWNTGNDTSTFTSNISAGDFYVEIEDSTDWQPIEPGDMLIFGDSTTFDPVTQYYRGDLLLFDHFEEVTGQTRMYFQMASLVDIDVKTQLHNQGGEPYTKKVPISQKTLMINDLTIVAGGLLVVGFEVAIGMNLVFYGEVITPTAADGFSAASYWKYCKTIYLVNYYARDYMILGNGYGVGFDTFDEVYLSNFYAYNCRHPLTTNNSYVGYSHKLTVTNGRAYFPYANRRYATGFDTHGNIWKVVFNNCRADGASTGFNLRARSLEINNCEVNDADFGITIATAGYSDIDKKKLIEIDGFKITNSSYFMSFTAPSKTEKVKINNLDASGLSQAVFSSEGHVDTKINEIILTNSIVKGTNNGDGSGVFVFKNNIPNTTDYTFDKVFFHNVKLDSIAGVASTARGDIQEFFYTGGESKISNYYYLFYTGGAVVDTTNHSDRKYLFKNVTFENGLDNANQITNNTLSRISKLTFDGCIFTDVESPINLYKTYIDTLIFNGNDYTAQSTLFRTVSPVYFKSVTINGNTINDAGSGGNSKFLSIGDMGDTITYNITNNNFYGRVDQLSYIIGTDINFVGNIIAPKEIDGSSENRFMRFNSGATGNILKNTFILNIGSGYTHGLEIDGSADSLTVTGNIFVAKNATSSTIPIRQDDGVLNLGINEVYGFSGASVFASGTQNQIPFMLHEYLINSTVAKADTILFVK